jgi:iron complex outermembrane recepter protein
VNDLNTEAAPASTTLALHAGYAVDWRGWALSAHARVDNVLDRRYAGSVIVNEGNGRFFEPAPGRSHVLKLTGTYAF